MLASCSLKGAVRSISIVCITWALLSSMPTHARDGGACTSAEACGGAFELTQGGGISVYQSRPIAVDVAIERAVIVIHGNRRDADRYFKALVASAALEDRLSDTLLVAPSFQAKQDNPPAGQNVWSSSGWKIGNRAKNLGRASSFTVIDEMLAAICPVKQKNFASLKQVTLVGHSAGGQFVNRYAAGGTGCPNPDVEMQYVVMNPSSYLYPDERRRSARGIGGLSLLGAQGEFRVPRFGCFDYNDYKYGLEDLNAYMKKVGAQRIRANLKVRNIFYFAGSKDNDPRSSSLDKSCEAERQGLHRLARFKNFRDYALLFDDWTGSTFKEVSGVGHNAKAMLKSEEVRQVLFR